MAFEGPTERSLDCSRLAIHSKAGKVDRGGKNPQLQLPFEQVAQMLSIQIFEPSTMFSSTGRYMLP